MGRQAEGIREMVIIKITRNGKNGEGQKMGREREVGLEGKGITRILLSIV